MDLLLKDEAYQIIGAAMDVHRDLGFGFLEPVYQEALSIEFGKRNIPFLKEEKLRIYYKDVILEKIYIADFVCFDKIIVEIKAVQQIIPEFVAQVLNYLNATHFRLGLIINFGEASLKYRRIIL